MFETVGMYTITALLTLCTPGAVQLHCLCWEHRQRPLGLAAGIPRAKYLCSHTVEWWENWDCREVQLLPLYCQAGHTAQGSSKRTFTVLLPSNSPHLSTGQQAKFVTAASCFKGFAIVEVRKYVLQPKPCKITWKIT